MKVCPALVVAASLHDLGTVAFYRSDLVKAEDYFRQGLAIRERLAPGGLDVAASFTGLGTVANYRGDQIPHLRIRDCEPYTLLARASVRDGTSREGHAVWERLRARHQRYGKSLAALRSG